jgi:CPA1 family monovalent cation:H+ antiporter
LLVVVLVRSASARLRVSFPILLVLVGLGISLVPELPRVTLAPDLVFLVFLPPLLYEAAWFTSGREFKYSQRSWRTGSACQFWSVG